MTEPKLKVLSVGWGVQSWAMLAMMVLDYLPRADVFIHSDTTFERSGTYEFAEQWTPWLGERGITVQTVRADSPKQWRDSKAVFIPAFTVNNDGKNGQSRRQCTQRWKIAPIRQLVRKEMDTRGISVAPEVVEMQTGITLDEFQRMRDSDVNYIKNTYPLVDRRITRGDCVAWLEENDLPVPPKSSCTFCPYQSKVAWMRNKSAGGSDWGEAVEIDNAIRSRRPDHTLFVHSSRLPLEEAVNIPEDFGATQPTFDDIESCDSGFCWT